MTRKERTQGERIVAIETKMDILQSDITDIKNTLKEDIGEIKTTIKKHIDWETSKYDAMKEQFKKDQIALKKELKKEYAAKWIERLVYAIIVLILASTIKIIWFGGI